MNSKFDCIDSGSENCPCYLALTGDCLVCTRLQGKDYCDCSWSGSCIYNEYMQSGGRVNNPRKDFLVPIIEKKFYQEDLIILTLHTGRGFALKACRPGSYIFLKTLSQKGYYNVPISVLYSMSENGSIQVAVRCISAKTKYIFEAEKELLVRGIYRNGILGLENLYGFGYNFDICKRILLITKGTGVAPGILLNRWLLQGNLESENTEIAGNLYMLVDDDKIPSSLLDAYLPGERPDWREADCPQRIRRINLAQVFSKEPANPLRSDLSAFLRSNGFDSVVVLTSDYYIQQLRKLLSDSRQLYGSCVPALAAYSNNFRICCGEGICGACSCVSETGEVFKMCKSCNHA